MPPNKEVVTSYPLPCQGVAVRTFRISDMGLDQGIRGVVYCRDLDTYTTPVPALSKEDAVDASFTVFAEGSTQVGCPFLSQGVCMASVTKPSENRHPNFPDAPAGCVHLNSGTSNQ